MTDWSFFRTWRFWAAVMVGSLIGTAVGFGLVSLFVSICS